ncbi:hypothetical protein MNBD_GAMMA03-875 [hydrothermal vent metagenome]|uniref:Uncharacterized protein n=1 Tax=hydrothermal vent metagenome TaxID=652676 RepID=A0A3B0W6Z1_9ZZZZ
MNSQTQNKAKTVSKASSAKVDTKKSTVKSEPKKSPAKKSELQEHIADQINRFSSKRVWPD